MTTIVYDHKNKLIAVDSRATTLSGLISTDSDKKWFYDDGGNIWFMTGSVCDKDLLLECFKDGDKAIGLKAIPDASALVVKGEKVLLRSVSDNGEAWTQELSFSKCIGSGASFALAALDFNLSAKESVSYAATRDCFTGGQVHVYDIESREFI